LAPAAACTAKASVSGYATKAARATVAPKAHTISRRPKAADAAIAAV
jgi:hypothetical protein